MCVCVCVYVFFFQSPRQTHKNNKEQNFTFGHEISIILYVYTGIDVFCFVCKSFTCTKLEQYVFFLFWKRIANSHCPPKNFITEPTIITLYRRVSADTFFHTRLYNRKVFMRHVLWKCYLKRCFSHILIYSCLDIMAKSNASLLKCPIHYAS